MIKCLMKLTLSFMVSFQKDTSKNIYNIIKTAIQLNSMSLVLYIVLFYFYFFIFIYIYWFFAESSPYISLYQRYSQMIFTSAIP